jgi:hypothetical protein
MNAIPIADSSLSWAWARVFLAAMDARGGELHPCMVSISGFGNGATLEDVQVRQLLDDELGRKGDTLCASVSATIFPISMWNPKRPDASDKLFQRYDRAWPGIKKCRPNQNGVYFRRMMAFDPRKDGDRPINQLQFVLDTYRQGNHRKSALQVAIFDPRKDHTNNRQKGFPCLQQVAFTPLSDGEMSVTGFYATQYQFEKAYGNYLGLHNLGTFIAHELGLRLTQVICMANFLKLGNAGKGQLEEFAKRLRVLEAKRRV